MEISLSKYFLIVQKYTLYFFISSREPSTLGISKSYSTQHGSAPSLPFESISPILHSSLLISFLFHFIYRMYESMHMISLFSLPLVWVCVFTVLQGWLEGFFFLPYKYQGWNLDLWAQWNVFTYWDTSLNPSMIALYLKIFWTIWTNVKYSLFVQQNWS